MIVVSDTSPITNLAAIGHFDLLKALYSKVHIADGVWDELNAGGLAWPGRDDVASAEWIERHSVANTSLIATLRRDLDKGESETIALATEMNATLVIMDENAGRRAAQRLGLQVVGVIGILIEAKSKGLITEVRPQLDALRQRAGFYISERLYRTALQLANENTVGVDGQ